MSQADRRRRGAPSRTSSRPASRAASKRGGFALPAAASMALVFVAAAVLHATSLTRPFFADDFLFLDQSRGRSLLATLASPDPIGNFVRPVGRQLWFWLVGHASGQSPVAFHVLNLMLFLACLALLHALVRRAAGSRAAVIACGFLALHTAADVPLLWCSGSQDLLAIAGALAALTLYGSARRLEAAICLVLALLSKESVVAVPLIAIVLDRREAESWRAAAVRAWPLFGATAVWAAFWIATALHHAPGGGTLSASPAALPAAFVHLAQVALGLEWRQGGLSRVLGTVPALIPLALVLVAVIAAPSGRAAAPAPPAPESRRAFPPIGTGLVWAALGAIPIVAVCSIWSSYYYLFALCGVALALGAWLAAAPRAIAALAITVLAWGSQVGRGVDEFQTSTAAWSTLSHVNRHYFERAMPRMTRYLAAMKTAHPTLPRGTTMFFGSIPWFLGFQTGDGPVVRWAYRDSSLHSYFIGAFTRERATRGSVVIMMAQGDSLADMRDPESLLAAGIASALDGRPVLARDLLEYADHLGAPAELNAYALGIVLWACPDTTGAGAAFVHAGVTLGPGPTPGLAAARARATSGDTLGAIGDMMRMLNSHAGDAELHAALADLCVRRTQQQGMGYLESLAARTLDPGNPVAWRRVGLAQVETRHFPAAKRSLERYFELAGANAAGDALARRALEAARQIEPGGRLAQSMLRGGAVIDLGH